MCDERVLRAHGYMGLGFLMADMQEGGRRQACLVPRCFSFSSFCEDIPTQKDDIAYQAHRGAISSVHRHTQHSLQQRPISCVSSLLIKAVERFSVMNCISGEQSLIHGREQESRPSVTFPLTLTALISIHSINLRGPCRPIPMPGTQRQHKQSR